MHTVVLPALATYTLRLTGSMTTPTTKLKPVLVAHEQLGTPSGVSNRDTLQIDAPVGDVRDKGHGVGAVELTEQRNPPRHTAGDDVLAGQ